MSESQGHGTPTAPVLFINARVFDGTHAESTPGMQVLVADGIIQEVSDGAIASATATRVDTNGRTLMPGLIDAHVHAYAFSTNPMTFVRAPLSYLAHYAARFLQHSLTCGFTTVRDVGGADIGLAHAIRDQLLPSPRLFYAGRILSQTGGHGDVREPDAEGGGAECGNHGLSSTFVTIVDGANQVRAAAREELRRGASHIKIMASGGIASPTDPLECTQFADEEICACVDEATRHGNYVAAHCHPDEAIQRCVKLGVRSIEHGTLIRPATADLVAARGAFIVPTLSIMFALQSDGERVDLPAGAREKLAKAIEYSLEGIHIMKQAGVKIGFGTDLAGPHHARRGTEFTLRARVLQPVDILISATSCNAELMGQQGSLGCISAGALADILVVDGDPLRDMGLLTANGRNLRVIMQGGRFYKREL